MSAGRRVTIRIPVRGYIEATASAPNGATPSEVAELLISGGHVEIPTGFYRGTDGAYAALLDTDAIGPEFTADDLAKLREG